MKGKTQTVEHRWKWRFGQIDVNEAKRMNEMERENAELKKMLARRATCGGDLDAIHSKSYHCP